MDLPLDIQENVPLAPLCSLELGGPARFFKVVRSEQSLVGILKWARSRGLKIAVLGQGTNLVIADRGFDGLVIQPALRGVALQPRTEGILLHASAGEQWDEIVKRTVTDGFWGIECLSGIPGWTGSSVVQNIGAYGQEISQTIAAVQVLDMRSLTTEVIPCEKCGFAYRNSIFKSHAARFIVLSVWVELSSQKGPALHYPDLIRIFGKASSPPTLSEVREAVLELRRDKSMLISPDDENHRSVGSFFINPIVSQGKYQKVLDAARRVGVIEGDNEMPIFPVDNKRVKLAAGWLIEKSGFSKGYRQGNVGLSTRHALSLVHHGNGSTRELIELAQKIRQRVESVFQLRLEPEPVFWGFEERPL